MDKVGLSGKYQTYPEHKDSGVEWLGVIPMEWANLEGKRLFKNRRELSFASDMQLAASQKYGVIPQSMMMKLNDAKVMLALKGTNAFRHVEKDDFVISLRSFEGGIEYSEYTGCVSPAYTVLTAIKEIWPSYYRYLFKSKPFIAALQSTTDSLRDGKSITFDQFGFINLIMPEFDEQQKIANFLDYETAKIDTLIEKQQQLIKLLKEKRQAVISHAVTKGLDPNAPMRDSGVEWLGEVPEHWKVISLKHLVSAPIIDGPHLTPIRQDEGVPFISAEAISQGYINFEKKWGYISREDHELYSKRYCPQRGDILMVKLGATTGVVAMVETDDEFNVWVPLATIRTREDISSKFVFYLFQSSNVRDAIQLSWTYGTQQTLGLGTLANLNLPVPPQGEIDQIVKLIESKIPVYDVSVKKCEVSLNYLQERRTALISAAVTGKIDVRDWVAPEPSNSTMD
jgi:type I restriction enzyme S subunit